ncbi:MAG: GntR family transcriptional regulator [Proteobacteria bacterium]|nr:GntR family transcriptional regulator [Pseudomonadota bacterium]
MSASTISERIYQGLIDQIITGQLKPGQRIEEQAIASQFGVSRTPVRDALRQLAGSGFINFKPHHGATVTDLDLDQLSEMLETLEELEALCTRFAARRMTAVERKHLEVLYQQQLDSVKRGDEPTYWQLNDEFHTSLCAGAHNRSIQQITENFRSRLLPFRAFVFSLGSRLETAPAEHRDVLDAILAGDEVRAYQAMRNHVATSNLRVITFLRQREQQTQGGSRSRAAMMT